MRRCKCKVLTDLMGEIIEHSYCGDAECNSRLWEKDYYGPCRWLHRHSRKRLLFYSTKWEDRIKAVVGVEELWFRNHDAEALGLYIKGMKDRSDRVKIAFLENYDELFKHRNNLGSRLQFIRDITKNPIVPNLISTLAKLILSQNEKLSNLASKNLILTMGLINPGLEREFDRNDVE